MILSVTTKRTYKSLSIPPEGPFPVQQFSMRQLDIFWIILLVFDLNPAAADPEKCHEVEKLKLVGYIHVCTCVPAVLNLGNEQKQSVLDFSKADPRTMNDFFGKKQDNGTDYCFTNIHGSVIINGNNQLDIVNFGEAINWHSKGLLIKV